MAWSEIPLDTTPDQEFVVTVDVDGENIPLMLHLRYNTEGQFWRMDVSDGRSGDMLISNVPMVTGERLAADILGQFEYLGIGSALIVPMTDCAESDSPNFFNLGTDFVLVWGKEEA